MIQTESIYINEREYIRTYSDAGFLIHGGSPEGDYSEAIDPAELNRTYTETDIPDESDNNTEIQNKAEAYDILTGGAS